MAKYLICIVGPTAIGKTALSIQIAQSFHCEIISCDSRQFFKEMRIGTAVPSEGELHAAQHHFIQNKSIFENYTVGDFEKEALATLDQLYKTNDYAILVGGSGLYVNAVLKGFDAFPEIAPEIRTQLIHEYETLGLPYLQEKLKELDPTYYEIVAKENPQRLLRALEVCIGSGQPYSSFLNKRDVKRDFIPIIIGLTADRSKLYERINLRVDLMMEQGLLKEVELLKEYQHLNALQTVGYKELFAYLNGEISLDFAIEEIKKNTRRFAKRQLTWFTKDTSTHWFDFETPTPNIVTFIKNKIATS